MVLSGCGEDPGEDYAFGVIPELAPDYPLNIETSAVLKRGQSDQKFAKYRSVLVEALRPILAEVDVTFVHNIFTMHFNLALTQALHDLSSEFRFVAWTHDLVACSTDYSVPNPTKPPWNLTRTACPKATYVAVSEVRRNEIESHLKPKQAVTVIPNAIDMGRLFNFTLEMRASLDALNISEREFIFLLPAAHILPRKNIEFAIQIAEAIKKQGRRLLLLITGADDPYNPTGAQYGKYLRSSLPESLLRSVVFVQDHFPVKDEMMRDLYSLADCLLFPSKQEGFGLPILEAALHRMPIWCNKVPAFWALQGEGMFMINELAQLSEAIRWLEAQPTFRLQRQVRQSYDLNLIYNRYYKSLIESMEKPLI
jgi:glycosyltransferase involved in cell wall biosynthesis